MLNILVIDDEESIAQSVKMALTRAGHNVSAATGGPEGIDMYDEGSFDLVITDMCMPGMDGSDVARHIRRSGKASGEIPTPIIGMSGTPWLMSENCFDALLVKPFSSKDLHGMIDRLTRAPQEAAVS